MISWFASNMTLLSLNFSIQSYLDRAQQLFFLKIPFDLIASWVRNFKWFLDIHRILCSIAFKVLCSLVSTSIYHASYPIILLQKSSSPANLAHSESPKYVSWFPARVNFACLIPLTFRVLPGTHLPIQTLGLFCSVSLKLGNALSLEDCVPILSINNEKGNFRAPREQDQWNNIPFLPYQMQCQIILGFFS